MPAVFKDKHWFADLIAAIRTVGDGARKVKGPGYSVYRIGATIRCDLTPLWVSPPEGEDATQSHLDDVVQAGQAEAEADAMFDRDKEEPHE